MLKKKAVLWHPLKLFPKKKDEVCRQHEKDVCLAILSTDFPVNVSQD